jgi:hypothetical protein
MKLVRRGEGPGLCGARTNQDTSCTHNEVEGLGACVWHMPDELLEEAEELTGWKRCRWRFGEDGACHYAAVKGTVPPRCKNHDANTGSVRAKHAAERVVEGKIADNLVVILAEHGEKLLDPDPLGNPFHELMDLGAEIKAFKEIMRQITAYLFSKDRIRYAHKSFGEQLRAEVMIYERAQERLAKILIDITRLNIEARLAAIEEQQMRTIEQAMTLAIQRAGGDLTMQDAIRRELVTELKKAG